METPRLLRPIYSSRTGGAELARLNRISRRQFGVFTRRQVLRAGLTDAWLQQRLTRGDLIRLHRGVFALGMAPKVWERDALAACLAGPPLTLLSHRSAAKALGLTLANESESGLEVTIPFGTELTLSGVRVHLTRTLHRADRTKAGRLPVTNFARTLIDLAGSVGDVALRNALDDGLARKLASPTVVVAAIERNRRHRRAGSNALAEAVAPWLGNALESPAEAEMLRLLRDQGLPVPTTKLTEELAGGQTFRLDFAWVAHRVALEVDGFRYHDGPARFIRDRHRANLLTAAGWHVIRTTLPEIRQDPEPLCAALRQVLAARSPLDSDGEKVL